MNGVDVGFILVVQIFWLCLLKILSPISSLTCSVTFAVGDINIPVGDNRWIFSIEQVIELLTQQFCSSLECL